MRIAVIGGSGHYRYVLNQLSSQKAVRIAPGTEGEDLGKLEQALAKHGIAYGKEENYQTLLDWAQVAVVNTRFDRNAVVTEAFLKRDIPVFSEKPLATTLEQLKHLQEVERESKAFVAGMFGIRYLPWFQTLKKAAAGIGSLRLINSQKSYKLGKRPDFYCHYETFGGIIPWVAIHALDWMSVLVDSPVTFLSAVTDTAFNGGHGDLEVTSLCHMKTESGVLLSVSADFLRPQGAPTHDDDRIRVVGSEGVVEYREGSVILTDDAGSRVLPMEAGEEVFELFLRRVAGEDVGVTSEESFRVTELALRAAAMARQV